MEQSPFGAIASEATRQLGGSQRAQDVALGLGTAADGVGMGYLGIARDPAAQFLGTTRQPGLPGPDMDHEAPASLEGMSAPRPPGLSDTASMSDLLRTAAVPGRDGVMLTDQVSDPSELFGAMGQLTGKTGLKYALVRHGGDLMLFSGAPGRVTTPGGAEPLAHTHPPNASGTVQLLPSRADVDGLNRLWAKTPTGRALNPLSYGARRQSR